MNVSNFRPINFRLCGARPAIVLTLPIDTSFSSVPKSIFCTFSEWLALVFWRTCLVLCQWHIWAGPSCCESVGIKHSLCITPRCTSLVGCEYLSIVTMKRGCSPQMFSEQWCSSCDHRMMTMQPRSTHPWLGSGIEARNACHTPWWHDPDVTLL